MYVVTKAQIGDLIGPFYLTTNGGWDTALYGGFARTFSNINEAANVAKQHEASVTEA